jgi:orotidine-5'-phosphate decarboxylase
MALKDGADLLVIGRPIRQATNPAQACSLILKEMAQALSESDQTTLS